MIALLLLALLPAAAPAGGGTLRPIDIDADTLVLQGKQSRAVFSGSVTVRRDDWTLTCDRLVVIYDESGHVTNLVATGSVKVVQGTRTLTAEEAHFDNQRELLTLKGKPTVVEGSNVLRGEVITYDLRRDEVRVEQVEAQIEVESLDRDGGQR
ncbi:MAG: lipopolysaccharide transport periplasmic protein LptA [Deltaproteobacteria bacterium]|nr:MAG: lipopolysaccharide transport periplasmic protein LptA [Deltaproteobacteria bacterium]